jgi:hypothetical protein
MYSEYMVISAPALGVRIMKVNKKSGLSRW